VVVKRAKWLFRLWIFILALAFLSFATTSSKPVVPLTSSPARVDLYSGPKPAKSVSVLIASLGLNLSSRFSISLYRRVNFDTPSSIIVTTWNLINSANRLRTLISSSVWYILFKIFYTFFTSLIFITCFNWLFVKDLLIIPTAIALFWRHIYYWALSFLGSSTRLYVYSKTLLSFKASIISSL
jgi:hypothetical protein